MLQELEGGGTGLIDENKPRGMREKSSESDLFNPGPLVPIFWQPRQNTRVRGDVVNIEQLRHSHRGDKLADACDVHRYIRCPNNAGVHGRLRPVPLPVKYRSTIAPQLHRISGDACAK